MDLVTNYIDYRKYIRDFYEEKKKFRGFSWGTFAKLSGIASPVFLQYVSENKKNLSEKIAPQVAHAMGLAGFEIDYFQLLVSFDNAKTIKSKENILKIITELGKVHKVKSVVADEYDFFKSWKNSLVRELASTMKGASPRQMASATRGRISTGEIREILNFLLKNHFLEQKEDGSFYYPNRSLKMETPSLQTNEFFKKENQVQKVVAQDLQIQMAELALDALKRESSDERNITGITLGITRENYSRIVKELAECRRRIIAIATETAQTDEVYRLNMQFFPLSNIKSNLDISKIKTKSLKLKSLKRRKNEKA